jgi:hypothetical protein
MRRFAVAALFLVSAAFARAGGPAGPAAWLDSLEAAKRAAAETGKPILLDIFAPW